MKSAGFSLTVYSLFSSATYATCKANSTVPTKLFADIKVTQPSLKPNSKFGLKLWDARSNGTFIGGAKSHTL